MDIGMLWYDDGKRPLAEKVTRAVEHYKAKYGAVPTVCFVNPKTLTDGPENAAGVQLRKSHNVLVDHFWIGVGDTNGNGNDNGRHANGKRGRAGSRGSSPHKNGRGQPIAAAE